MDLYTEQKMANFNDPNNIDVSKRSSNIRTVSTTKEYLNLITPLSKVEFDLLKQSIKEEGLHIPIVVNKQGIVLDGHHRFQACKELGIPLKYQTKEFKDSLEEKQFVIEVNLRRRQLNEFQRVEMGYILEDMQKEMAKRRMSLGGHIIGQANRNLLGNDKLDTTLSISSAHIYIK